MSHPGRHGGLAFQTAAGERIRALTAADLLGCVEGIGPDACIALHACLSQAQGASPDALRTALAELALSLNGETGFEAAVARVLALCIDAMPVGAARTACTTGQARFAARMADNFNAAEAARQALGQLATACVRAAFHASPKDFTANAVTQAIKDADFFALRVEPGPSDGVFTLLAQALPPSQAPVTPEMRAACGALVDDLAAPAAARRFRPLSTPAPLPIQIMPPLDESGHDSLSAAVQGFGIIVAAKDATGPVIVEHASLAQVKVGNWVAQPVIRPLTPALVDGAPVLFAEYNGRPFAGAGDAAAEADAGAVLDAVQAEAAARAQPFFTVEPFVPADPVNPTHAGVDQLPPPLAYGLDYAALAFWIPNSGALPKPLQDGDRFTPKAVPAEFQPTDFVPYLRQTQIAETGIAGDGARRIDVFPADVIPLHDDHPRHVLCAFAGGSAVLDVWRRPDGTGVVPVGTQHRSCGCPSG